MWRSVAGCSAGRSSVRQSRPREAGNVVLCHTTQLMAQGAVDYSQFNATSDMCICVCIYIYMLLRNLKTHLHIYELQCGCGGNAMDEASGSKRLRRKQLKILKFTTHRALLMMQ